MTTTARALRCAAVLIALVVAGVLASSAPARAANCPTQSFLNFNHLAYAEVDIPAAVRLSPGSTVGRGTVDQPTSSNGCKRQKVSVKIHTAASIDPRVAVFASGRPRTLFVIGSRCSGFAGSAYWACLTQPLHFDHHQLTATSYPATPAPRGS